MKTYSLIKENVGNFLPHSPIDVSYQYWVYRNGEDGKPKPTGLVFRGTKAECDAWIELNTQKEG